MVDKYSISDFEGYCEVSRITGFNELVVLEEWIVKSLKDRFKDDSSNTFEAILLDFYGSACPPCIRLMPILDSLASESRVFTNISESVPSCSKISLFKIDCGHNPELSGEYDISKIPTLVLLFRRQGGDNNKDEM